MLSCTPLACISGASVIGGDGGSRSMRSRWDGGEREVDGETLLMLVQPVVVVAPAVAAVVGVNGSSIILSWLTLAVCASRIGEDDRLAAVLLSWVVVVVVVVEVIVCSNAIDDVVSLFKSGEEDVDTDSPLHPPLRLPFMARIFASCCPVVIVVFSRLSPAVPLLSTTSSTVVAGS